MGNRSESNKGFIHWFRNDLRLHDMPAINVALKKHNVLYPVYIFDESEIKEQKIGYNRIRFILEALQDIDTKLRQHGGRLFVYTGNPLEILSSLIHKWSISCISYEEDTEAGFANVESSIKQLCVEKDVEIVKCVSHTLWDLGEILKANNGSPPVTFEVFNLVVEVLGPPKRPKSELDLSSLTLANEEDPLSLLPSSPEEMGYQMECTQQINKVYLGGETRALQHLEERLKIERKALKAGLIMPNQVRPDLLGPPMSMSAALSRGCLSIRRFYWSLLDLYESEDSDFFLSDSLISQLMWREYFYAMSKNNPFYATMQKNPICLNIPWTTDDKLLKCWTEGMTGFPFIDAAIRQMRHEGWIHHVARNAVACFLTRGHLWISWEEGFKVFMRYLIDADVAVCAGNWMWVSSSAFEIILQNTTVVCPVTYGRHFEQTGEYIRKYIPELLNFPPQYIWEPWTAPIDVQESAKCIIGKDYPLPIVCHKEAQKKNTSRMEDFRKVFLGSATPLHCAPSSSMEASAFMGLPKECLENLRHTLF